LSDCSQEGCNYPPQTGCSSSGCSEATSECGDQPCETAVAAAGGSCLNGGTKLNNGVCLCQHGYEGSRCEYSVVGNTLPVAGESFIIKLSQFLC